MKHIGAIAGVACVLLSVAACKRKEPDAPPVATPSVTVNHDRAPLGSPLDITYKFVVASDAKFDEDYRVMLHVVDTDEEMIWTDDHNPPIPTRQWKPGQTVDYTRTIFVPVYPYVGEATLEVGLYSTSSQKRLPLNGENVGQRAYKVGRIFRPSSKTGGMRPKSSSITSRFSGSGPRKRRPSRSRIPKKTASSISTSITPRLSSVSRGACSSP